MININKLVKHLLLITLFVFLTGCVEQSTVRRGLAQAPPPSQTFRDRLADGSLGPEMVWIAAGSFRMGDIQGGGDSDEKPVHRVVVNKFALGRYEVTFAEYDKFASTTGRKKPDDEGWGRGNRPVIKVSWNDATAYAKWLSGQTGKRYRLPTEAEWEYAARAGTETKYWWGNKIGKNRAACDGCGAKWGWDAKKMTAPVGSFAANQFGVYDTVGNVWEWTCSEYENKYKGKEKHCLSKNRTTNNNHLVLRGGSWYFGPRDVRSAYRNWRRPTDRGRNYGFRLSRL
jgi:formylglycine-generating enzyme required for sulfatase activity